jgi:hypothetical protein
MKPLVREWNTEEIDKLKSLVMAGATPARAAVALRRSRGSVQNKAREIGVPFPHTVQARMERQARYLAAKVLTGP